MTNEQRICNGERITLIILLRKLDSHMHKAETEQHAWPPTNLLLLQQCSHKTDFGTPLLLASKHPPTSFLVTTSGTNTHHFLWLTILWIAPYCQPTISSQIHQNYFNEVKNIISYLVNLYLQSSYISLPLWTSISATTKWLQEVWVTLALLKM